MYKKNLFLNKFRFEIFMLRHTKLIYIYIYIYLSFWGRQCQLSRAHVTIMMIRMKKRFLVYLEQYSNYKRVKNITLTFPLQATTTWQENWLVKIQRKNWGSPINRNEWFTPKYLLIYEHWEQTDNVAENELCIILAMLLWLNEYLELLYLKYAFFLAPFFFSWLKVI